MKKYPKRVLGQKHKKGPSSKNSGVHYFRLKLDIDLNAADTNVSWAPNILMNNSSHLASEFTFYKIHSAEIVFTPIWNAGQPEVNNGTSDPLTTMWYRYLTYGAPDVNESNIRMMENSRRAVMTGTKHFRCYDLSNADMRTSKSDDSNNTLPFERIKIDNHCWRKFKDGIKWYFMAFQFDNVISDDYQCYMIIHVHVKNYEGAAPQKGVEFGVKVGAMSNYEEIDDIGMYGNSLATREEKDTVNSESYVTTT